MIIRLIYTKPKKVAFPIISYGIRLLTRSKYSHVIMVFEEDNVGFHIYFNEWLLQPLEEILKNHEIVSEQHIEVTDKIYANILREAKKDREVMLNHKNYDVTCSESLYYRLVYRLRTIMIYRVMINELPSRKVSNISPKELFNVFKGIMEK